MATAEGAAGDEPDRTDKKGTHTLFLFGAIGVPYKGSEPAASALLEGEVMASFDALQATLPHVRTKRLRALAIGSPKRAPVAPEIPTFAEAAFPEFTASAWFGLFAPANTPRDIAKFSKIARQAGIRAE